MLLVLVNIRVKPDAVEKFKAATIENARNSRKEPGVARFDFAQNSDDPTRFILVEVYRNATAPAAHKETAHYKAWREVVDPIMAETRASVKFETVYPEPASW